MYKRIRIMSYSTSTVIQCWQWKEVIKNRYNYRKGTKSTDPSFPSPPPQTIFVFTLLFKDTSLKASYVWVFLGFTTSLVFKHRVGGRDQARNNYSKTNVSNLHRSIQTATSRTRAREQLLSSDTWTEPTATPRTSGGPSLTFLCIEDQNLVPIAKNCVTAFE